MYKKAFFLMKKEKKPELLLVLLVRTNGVIGSQVVARGKSLSGIVCHINASCIIPHENILRVCYVR